MGTRSQPEQYIQAGLGRCTEAQIPRFRRVWFPGRFQTHGGRPWARPEPAKTPSRWATTSRCSFGGMQAHSPKGLPLQGRLAQSTNAGAALLLSGWTSRAAGPNASVMHINRKWLRSPGGWWGAMPPRLAADATGTSPFSIAVAPCEISCGHRLASLPPSPRGVGRRGAETRQTYQRRRSIEIVALSPGVRRSSRAVSFVSRTTADGCL